MMSGVQGQDDWSMDVIDRQIRLLARLVDDLLDVSRITRGKIQLHKERIDAYPVVNSAIEVVRPLIEQRAHELTVSMRPGLRLEADPTRLEQILVNLLTNAAKYTESGGNISLTARQEENDLVIKIRDTGIGIGPRNCPGCSNSSPRGPLPRPFRRRTWDWPHAVAPWRSCMGEASPQRAKALARGANSSCDCPRPRHRSRRRRGRGRSPLRQPSKSPASSSSMTTWTPPGDFRGSSSSWAIMSRRHTTDRQPSRRPVVDRPEFVLLDIGLPGMDGYQVATHLRQEQYSKDAVIIAVTGYGQEDDLRRSREAGFDHHLVKPIDHDALITLIGHSQYSIDELLF